MDIQSNRQKQEENDWITENCRIPMSFSLRKKITIRPEKPVYVIQNINLTLGLPFEDGTHILYVNGEYRGDSDIGRLMHDFNCTSAEDMNFDLMAERTRYLKENPKGVGSMCKAMEELRVESYAEGKAEGVEIGKMEQAKKTALRLSRKGNSVEEIADLLGYDVDTVSSWIAPKAC